MNCPACGVIASAESNFCVKCGARLRIACPGCGEVNSAVSRYCHACGSALPDGAPPTPPPVKDIACPRCHAVNDQSATFCYACGLPLDEQRPLAGQSVALGVPAGFWIRLLAWVIDSVILNVFWLIAGEFLPIFPIPEPYEQTSIGTLLYWFDPIAILFNMAYDVISISAFYGTIGMRVLRLYVLRTDGSKLSLLRSLARYFAALLSSLMLGIGFLMIAFSHDKRALHDHICDTMVVIRRHS